MNPRLSRIARQQRLGRILGVVRAPATWPTLFVVGLPLLLYIYAEIAHPIRGLSFQGQVIGRVAMVGLFLAIHRLLNPERLAICENGLIIGASLPTVRPFVVRWEQIDLTTMVFLSSYDNSGKLVGRGWSSARRAYLGHGTALSFAGPSIEAATLPSRWTTNPSFELASTGGVMWAFGCGARHRTRTTRLLVTALAPRLGPHLAAFQAQLARQIDLSPDPEVSLHQIPGLVEVTHRPSSPIF